MTDPIHAPFTAEQVAALNAHQSSGHHHPFTCGNPACRAVLVATRDGWVCPRPNCPYTQDWAHAFMAGGAT